MGKWIKRKMTFLSISDQEAAAAKIGATEAAQDFQSLIWSGP